MQTAKHAAQEQNHAERIAIESYREMVHYLLDRE